MLRASVTELHFGTHGSQKIALSDDVADLGNIFEDDWFFGKKGRGHCRKGGILRAAHADSAEKRVTAANYEFIHEYRSDE